MSGDEHQVPDGEPETPAEEHCYICDGRGEDCMACERGGNDDLDGRCYTCGGAGWFIPEHCCACGGSPYCNCCSKCGASCVSECKCPIPVQLSDGSVMTV